MHDLFSRYAERLHRFIETSSNSGFSPPVGPQPESTFDSLALELFQIQFEAVPAYRRFVARRASENIVVNSWEAIPALPVEAFKEFEVTSLPSAARTTVFHSSGTTGTNPSRQFHDAVSLQVYQTSALAGFRPHLLHDLPARARLISLTPAPAQAPHSSLVHMIETVRRRQDWLAAGYFSRSLSRETGWELDGHQTIAALREAEADGQSVLLVGTAFSFVALLDFLSDTGTAVHLPPDSRVMETGGYKGRSRTLPRAELHAGISRHLGIPVQNVIAEYGMSELSSQAYDRRFGSRTERGRFRFPPWARARIVSSETLDEVAVGETGIVEVVDLANLRSVLAIRTGDLAIRHEDGFELLGRIPSAEPRGCSLMVST